MPGMHHVTAIAGDPVKNVSFYTRDLGLRFVKKTVNFDDPSTYHFYFGDETGSPGTILTFFPWTNVPAGQGGVGENAPDGFPRPAAVNRLLDSAFHREGNSPPDAGETLRSVRAAFHGSGWDGARARRHRRCRE